MKDPAKWTEQIIAIGRGRPLNRIHTEGHRRHDDANGLPPLRERYGIEEACEDRRRLRGDVETLFEPACGIRCNGRQANPGTWNLEPYFFRRLCAYATTAQTCSLVISSEKAGIFGF